MPPFSDSTLSVLAHGYAWLPNRTRTSTDGTVGTRLPGRPTIAMRGPEGLGFSYDERHVLRSAALPDPVLDTLFGQGAAHTLDGDAHRARKAMFLALLKDETGIAALGEHVGRRWREAASGWKQHRVVLFDETGQVLARAVCDWAGLQLSEAESTEMARDCTAMVDGFATPGSRHLRARRARAHQEKALATVITGIREKPRADTELSALEAVARHRDADGNLLDTHTAAVELLNIIRPSVAIAWFATFAAHCLYGQNHDPAAWEHPYRSDPHRFAGTDQLPDNLVPLGGGTTARPLRRSGATSSRGAAASGPGGQASAGPVRSVEVALPACGPDIKKASIGAKSVLAGRSPVDRDSPGPREGWTATGKDTEGMGQATHRKAALITDQLTGAAIPPTEATNGVPPTRAALTQLMLRRGAPLLAAAALAALMWRTGK